MEETLQRILTLFGYWAYLLLIAFIVGLPILVVIVFIANWFYRRVGKRLEEELRKRYEREREDLK